MVKVSDLLAQQAKPWIDLYRVIFGGGSVPCEHSSMECVGHGCMLSNTVCYQLPAEKRVEVYRGAVLLHETRVRRITLKNRSLSRPPPIPARGCNAFVPPYPTVRSFLSCDYLTPARGVRGVPSSEQVLTHVREAQQMHRRRVDLREIRPGRFEKVRQQGEGKKNENRDGERHAAGRNKIDTPAFIRKKNAKEKSDKIYSACTGYRAKVGLQLTCASLGRFYDQPRLTIDSRTVLFTVSSLRSISIYIYLSPYFSIFFPCLCLSLFFSLYRSLYPRPHPPLSLYLSGGPVGRREA